MEEESWVVANGSYCAVHGSSKPFQLVDVFRPVSVSTVPDLYRVVSTTFAPGRDRLQDRTVKALDEASKLAAPVQPDAGASVAAAIPVLVPYVPQAMPLPVPVDALYVSSQMPVMTQRRILGARVRRFPKLHSQTTVDDVASYIALLPGCARCSETFRRHQIDGKALLRLRKQCLILRMKIDLAPALKIVAAIDWLRRQEKKSPPSPK
nr:polyhomeotic-like protein 2 [Rhipicephalus microplus]